jgi:hypothetical protein
MLISPNVAQFLGNKEVCDLKASSRFSCLCEKPLQNRKRHGATMLFRLPHHFVPRRIIARLFNKVMTFPR